MDQTKDKTQHSTTDIVRIGLRILIPICFVVLTVFNVISLVHERSTPKPTTPSPSQKVRLATVGEIGSSESAQATLAAMAAKNPDLYLGLGDLSDEGAGAEPKWCSLVRSYIGPVAPFELVAGSREEDGSGTDNLDSLASCLPDRMSAVGKYAAQYYFDLGSLARVIVISPDLTVDGTYYYYSHGSPEYGWLQSTIAGAHASGKHWVIVAMNDDCISAGQYYCDINKDLISLLVTDHVDLVLSARDHSYQRSAQISLRGRECAQVAIDSFNPRCRVSRSGTEMRAHAGTVFAVVGSASSDLYPINESNPVARYLDAAMGENRSPRRGFLMLTITKSTLSGSFDPSSPGTFTDQFKIEATRTRGHAQAGGSTHATTPTT